MRNLWVTKNRLTVRKYDFCMKVWCANNKQNNVLKSGSSLFKVIVTVKSIGLLLIGV